jgi:hypothetical protein
LLIKELVSLCVTKAASGNGFFEGDFLGLEAAHKSKRRYPNETGNWVYSSYSHQPPLYLASGKLLHAANAADDWVFTQYYPVLRAAHPKKNNSCKCILRNIGIS